MPINARDYALRLLAIRPRSVRELTDRLKRKGFESQAVNTVIADLSELGLLDDAKFARDWAESRMTFRPMGPDRLRAELLAKGVERETIDTILSIYSDEKRAKDAALSLAHKKMKTLRGLEPQIARRRLAGFLGRRGFAPPIIADVLRMMQLGKHEV